MLNTVQCIASSPQKVVSSTEHTKPESTVLSILSLNYWRRCQLISLQCVLQRHRPFYPFHISECHMRLLFSGTLLLQRCIMASYFKDVFVFIGWAALWREETEKDLAHAGVLGCFWNPHIVYLSDGTSFHYHQELGRVLGTPHPRQH